MLGGCSGEDSGGAATTTSALACVPGQQIGCACAGGTKGVQICSADGAGYGACEGCSGAGGGADGGGGAGGGSSCAPGTTQACYSGPPGTASVGICHEGSRTCAADGSSFGPCTGEVLPSVETCATPEDDDCDGQTNEDGAGCACVPNATMPCYEGPSGTQDVGACKAGTATCNALGACAGQVLPSTDYCVTLVDEDCDGAQAPCVATPPWSKSYGAPNTYAAVQRVATDGAGNVVFAAYGNPIDVGAGPTQGSLVAELDALGNLVWSHPLPMYAGVIDLAVDGAGNVVVVGSYSGTPGPDFGGGPLPAVGNSSADFVLKLDAAGGHLWSASLGTTSFTPAAVATDAQGNVAIAGHLTFCVDFGAGNVCPVGSQGDLVVEKRTALNAHVWTKTSGAGTTAYATGIACDAQGNVAVGGYVVPSGDLGTGTIGGNSGSAAFAAVVTGAGAPVFVKAIGEAGKVQPAFDGTGGLYLVGESLGGVVDLGGGPITPNQPNNSNDVWVGGLDATTGAHVWSAGLGNGLQQGLGGAAVDGAGNLVLIGWFKGLAAMGGQFLQSYGYEDVFVAGYDPSGAGIGAQHFGDPTMWQYGNAVAVDVFGAWIVGGQFWGAIDFGSGTLTTVGIQDAFLAKLGP